MMLLMSEYEFGLLCFAVTCSLILAADRLTFCAADLFCASENSEKEKGIMVLGYEASWLGDYHIAVPL